MSLCNCAACAAMPIDPHNPHFHKNPATGIAPTHEWGPACQRGWVRDERFGSGQVIAGTNRNKTRQVYRKEATQAANRKCV